MQILQEPIQVYARIYVLISKLFPLPAFPAGKLFSSFKNNEEATAYSLTFS